MRYYNESDPFKAQVIRELVRMGAIPQGEVDDRSITDVTPRDLDGFTQCHFFAGVAVWPYALGLAGWDEGRGCWTGSPPCQPWSKAGRRDGPDDDRHLWPDWFRLIEACRPDIVFFEQVSAEESIGSVQFTPTGGTTDRTEWAWIDNVQYDFEGASYAVGHRSFPAACVGAPHARGRLYGVAHTSGPRLERLVKRGDHQDQWITGTGRVATPACGGRTGGRWGEWEARKGTDGRWRFTEPGVEPCVDGSARDVGCGIDPRIPTQEARVERIHSYGDAVVSEQAAAFVRAAMEVIK